MPQRGGTGRHRARALASLFAALGLGAAPGAAQVVRDGSIGPPEAGPVPFDDATGTWSIGDDLGAFSDDFRSLFHSFSRFDLPEGQTARFSSAMTPDRVIARVTGGDPSLIRGTLRSTIDGADLFLLNPSGISITDGARLDLRGSLYVSTADALRFEDGTSFDAGSASPVPLLSSATPAAFGFTRDAPARIDVARTSGLAVPLGETLALVGGDVSMISTFGRGANVRAPGATFAIGSAGGPVDLPVDLASFDPSGLEPGTLGDVIVEADSFIDMSSSALGSAGGVVIRGERFVLNRSRILVRNGASAPPREGVDVAVRGAVEIENAAQITAWAAADGGAGPISLRGQSVRVSDDAVLNSFATSVSDGPPIVLEGASIEVEDGGRVSSLGGGTARSGALHLRADDIRVTGGSIASLTSGAGDGGAVEIAAGTLEVSDAGQIVSRTDGPGRGGALDLRAGEVHVVDAGRVQSEATAGGDGGALAIRADLLRVWSQTDRAEGTFVSTNTLGTGDAGRGGDLSLHTTRLELVRGGQVFARTEGAGDAGALSVIGADVVIARGRDANGSPSGLTARTLADATGRGGSLEIETRILEVDDGAQISAATFGPGDAGALRILASERVTVRGGEAGPSLVSAASVVNATNPVVVGRGGDLLVSTDVLELRNGGQISASASGTGDAGALGVFARSVQVSGADPTGVNVSGIFSRSNTEGVPEGGDGGDLTLAADTLRMADGGRISVTTSGGGDAGSIVLDLAHALDLSAGARISALSSDPGSGGDGGAIRITADDHVALGGGSEISARSQGTGLAGDIRIDAGLRFESRGASVTTEALRSSGGRVDIAAADIFYLLGADVTTSVLQGAGGGGDVAVDSGLVVLDRGEIRANAQLGPGGNIRIGGGRFLASADSTVSASSSLGIDGLIRIEAPEADLSGELVTLQGSFLDASELLTSTCDARTARAGSFVVHRRSAVPLPPGEALPAASTGSPAACASPEETP